MAVGAGFMEMLMVLLLSGGGFFSGAGLMGLPPAERDAAFLRCAPEGAVLYAEWAERSAGRPGAKGIDGLVADPEVKLFVEKVRQAILDAVDEGPGRARPEQQVLAQNVPPLVMILANRSGCLYADYDVEAGIEALKGVKAGKARPAEAPLAGVRATLVVNGSDRADDAAKHITALVGLLPVEMRKENLDRQPLPVPFDLSLTLHRHKDYFILGFGKGTIDAAIAGLDGKSKGLASDERFTAAMKRVSFERTASVGWLDVRGALAKASKIFGLQVEGVAKMVGADALDSIVTATGVNDGQIEYKTFIGTGGRTDGIMSLTAGRAIKPADFKFVPADSDLVVAWSLNAPKIYREARKIIATAGRGSIKIFDDVVAQIEKELGLSLEEDIFKAFGDVWTIHNSPASGKIFLTGLIAGLEVRDPAKAEKVFAQLMKVFKGALPGEMAGGFRRRAVYLSEGKFMDRTIYYVNTVGDEIPFAPAFCVTDRQVLVALNPQVIKAHLRFVDGLKGEAGGAPREATFDSRLGKEIPLPSQDLLSLSYVDAKTVIGQLYALAPYVGQVIFSEIQRDGGEIDIFSLPSARAIVPYIGKSISTCTRTKDGIMIEGRAALPNPSAAMLPMPMLMWGFAVRVDRGGAAAPRAIKAVP